MNGQKHLTLMKYVNLYTDNSQHLIYNSNLAKPSSNDNVCEIKRSNNNVLFMVTVGENVLSVQAVCACHLRLCHEKVQTPW